MLQEVSVKSSLVKLKQYYKGMFLYFNLCIIYCNYAFLYQLPKFYYQYVLSFQFQSCLKILLKLILLIFPNVKANQSEESSDKHYNI